MDLRLDIERRKRFAGKERDYRREGGRSPGGSRGPSRERSSEKSGKHHKKSKYVRSPLQALNCRSATGHSHRMSGAVVAVITGDVLQRHNTNITTLSSLPSTNHHCAKSTEN